MGWRALGRGEVMPLCMALLAAAPLPASDASSCRGCHPSEYQAWAASRHRAAFENPIFQRGYQRDPALRCLVCHRPFPETASDGVSCASCHPGAHVKDAVPVEDLHREGFCARCHQFRFEGLDELAQRTFQEWAAYRRAGGTGTCQSCHMPEGSHAFTGSHDAQWLRRAVGVAFARVGDELKVELTNRLAGHDLPTGDLFREIRVEAREENSHVFEISARIGRRGVFVVTDGVPRLEWRSDNALRPGETRTVALGLAGIAEVRVVYSYEARLDPSVKPAQAVLASWVPVR
jgi:hypothetical protein